MKTTLRKLLNDPALFDDKTVVKKWLESRTTLELFDIFSDLLQSRIGMFETYARLVKLNCSYNTTLFDGDENDENHLKLVETRNKVLAGQKVDELERLAYVDGIEIIKKINDLTSEK